MQKTLQFENHPNFDQTPQGVSGKSSQLKPLANKVANKVILSKFEQEKVVANYIPALRALAWRLSGKSGGKIHFEDFFSIGAEEMSKQVKRYDPKINSSFWGFVRQRVHGAMLDYQRTLDMIPRNKRLILKLMEKEIKVFQNENQTDEEPSLDYLAKRTGVNSKKIEKVLNKREVGIVPFEDWTASETFDLDSEIDSERELELVLEAATRLLSERDLKIFKLYFLEDFTLKEIAISFGLTVPAISQIKISAIQKIKEDLGVED